MSTGQHPLSDAKRVARIKALLHDIDVVVCMYPFAFVFRSWRRSLGWTARKADIFFSTRQETLSVLKLAKAPHMTLISEKLNTGSGLDLRRVPFAITSVK